MDLCQLKVPIVLRLNKNTAHGSSSNAPFSMLPVSTLKGQRAPAQRPSSRAKPYQTGVHRVCESPDLSIENLNERQQVPLSGNQAQGAGTRTCGLVLESRIDERRVASAVCEAAPLPLFGQGTAAVKTVVSFPPPVNGNITIGSASAQF